MKLGKQTSTATIVSEACRLLRLFGYEYLLSNEDKAKAKPSQLNQQNMADRLGLTKAAYSKIENGDVIINVLQISQICKIFNVSLVDFFNYVEAKCRSLEEQGIKVLDERILLRLDHIRWQNKLTEKTEANFNKVIREEKKNKTFSLLNEDDLKNLKKDAKSLALKELDKRYPLEEAFNMQTWEVLR